MYAVWKDSWGRYMLSRRSPNGYGMPVYNPNLGGASVINLAIAAPAWAAIAVSIRRPNDGTLTSATPMIYAYSARQVSTPNSPASNFPEHHRSYGYISQIDFMTSQRNQVTTSQNTSPLMAPQSQQNQARPFSNAVAVSSTTGSPAIASKGMKTF